LLSALQKKSEWPAELPRADRRPGGSDASNRAGSKPRSPTRRLCARVRRGGINAGTNRAGHSIFRMTNTRQESPGADLYWESQCAERLGISRTSIRQLRRGHLSPELDWQLRDNAVVLTSIGLQKIERLLAAQSTLPAAAQNPATGPRGATAVPPGPPPSRRFMVVRIPVFRTDSPQRKVLICRECGDGVEAVASWRVSQLMPSLGPERPVRVRDNANFTPGMVFEAISLPHGLWQYAGRLPRRPGKW
jgi:hypothetical protein